MTPGILLITVARGRQGTAISVAMDMTEGIIARFRTMAISRAAVLTGHVLGSMIQSLLSLAVVIGVAMALGFRTSTARCPGSRTAGMLVLITFAITWLSVALGLVSGNPETASNLPMFLMVLPFLGSGFVPTHTMPAGLRWFAEYQPFTPVIQTLRGLLVGGPIGDNAGHGHRLGRRHRRAVLPVGQETVPAPDAGQVTRAAAVTAEGLAVSTTAAARDLVRCGHVMRSRRVLPCGPWPAGVHVVSLAE